MLPPSTAIFLILTFLALSTHNSAYGDQPASSDQRLAFAKLAADSYQFRLDERIKSSVTRLAEPVLRWNNQVIREDDGLLFVWKEGEKGRPVAAAQFFLVDGNWNHEFQSLCLSGFQATDNAQRGLDWTWRPSGPGIEFMEASDMPAPADSPPQRLRQMKLLLERFTAEVDPSSELKSVEQLRLLTTPVYRYSAIEKSILDGAMFAFVQGTNPEILILVEAKGTGDTKMWQFGFARMSCFDLRLQCNGKQIWKQSRAPVPTLDKSSAYHFRISVEVDRSAELPPSEAKRPNN